MKPTASAGRLTGAVATAALALALPLAFAGPARAATTTPLQCQSVGAFNTLPGADILSQLLGVTPPAITAPAGLNCVPVPNGDPRVNLCATQNISGLLAWGQWPQGHTCP